MGLRIGNKTVTEIIRTVDDGTGTGTTIEEITKILGGGDIDLPSPTADEIEVTDQESDAREFIQGLVDFGTFTMSGNLDDESAQHLLLTELHETGEDIKLRVTTKTGFTRTYRGFVKVYTPHFPVTEAASFDLEIRINGRVAVV